MQSDGSWEEAIESLSAFQKKALETACLRLAKAMIEEEPVIIMFPVEDGTEVHYLAGKDWPTSEVLNDSMSALMDVAATAPFKETEQ